MTPEIHDISALNLKLKRTTGKPASFLVGAPFSWENGIGVPPVSGFIEVIRKRVAAEGADFSKELEARLAGADAAGKYQAAMNFVFSVLDADVVTEIVQSAVLSARKAGTPSLDPHNGSDGEPDEWNITQGQRGLAHLIKLDPNRFSGPVFTTNFDPMIGLALYAQGIRYQPYTIPLEGSLNAPISVAHDDVNIFHLHGYWRDSPTLHSPQQLEAKRAQLQTSLEKHLNQTNLVVMAYSGWDDIFTSALANCLSSDTFSGTVTWCFYGSSPAEIREQNAALFEKFKGGIQQERITFFHSVNCHTFFDDLIADLGFDPATRSAVETSPLAGWEMVTKERLEAFDPLTGEEAVRFFDGAVPTLRHAISPLIPTLSHVAALVDRIDQGLANSADCSMQLVRSAGGEGKSTALLQAAVAAARERDCVVLHRPSPDAGLNPDVVASLDPDHQWVLVADEAEGLISDLWQCAVRLHDSGRHNVTYLLAARDTDWLAEKGDQKGWNGRLSRLDDIVLGGIAADDAELVVDAWSEQGDVGLRGLMSEKSRDERIKKLVAATRAKDVKGGDGSFFGGLLDTRFSGSALIDHVVTLMEPLRHREIGGGAGTLYDALLYIANCHAVGMPGLDKRVLASICDLPVNRVSSSITRVLGREMGAAESRLHVLTRHQMVADAVVVAAETRFDTDLLDIWERLVVETVKCAKTERFDPQFHGGIVHSGVRLSDRLPEGLSARRRGFIGIAAAEVAMEALPQRADVIIDRARALRFAAKNMDDDESQELIQEAFGHMMNSLGALNKAVDKASTTRGYFTEWGTVAGQLEGRDGKVTNVWLACLSISDKFNFEITQENARISLNGIQVGCESLNAVATDPYARGRRAATVLRRAATNDYYNSRHDQALNRMGVEVPSNLSEALTWLGDVAVAAHAELQDTFLKKFAPTGRLTFKKLRESIGK